MFFCDAICWCDHQIGSQLQQHPPETAEISGHVCRAAMTAAMRFSWSLNRSWRDETKWASCLSHHQSLAARPCFTSFYIVFSAVFCSSIATRITSTADFSLTSSSYSRNKCCNARIAWAQRHSGTPVLTRENSACLTFKLFHVAYVHTSSYVQVRIGLVIISIPLFWVLDPRFFPWIFDYPGICCLNPYSCCPKSEKNWLKFDYHIW